MCTVGLRSKNLTGHYACRSDCDSYSDGGSNPPASTRLRPQRSGGRSLPRRSISSTARNPKPGRYNVLRTMPGQAKMHYTYVYILQSVNDPSQHYTGLTSDIKARLKKHNEGGCFHTAKFKPWKIKTAIAFTERERAAKFEQYLKSHSGRVFAFRHF